MADININSLLILSRQAIFLAEFYVPAFLGKPCTQTLKVFPLKQGKLLKKRAWRQNIC